MTQTRHLSMAIEAAKAAEGIILGYYKGDIEIELKSDETPVTVADVEAERAIKAVLGQAFPDHGFYGEETGFDNPEADYTWLIDPIDGTKSFVRRNPFFSTQIALMHHDQLVLGVSNGPLMGELAYAERGHGAWLNGLQVATSGVTTIVASDLSFGNIASLAEAERWQRIGQLLQQVNRIRGYGDFYHYHLLASGRLEAVVESDVNILDIAALSVIIEEAGGMVTDLEGRPLNLATTSVLAASTPDLHQHLRAALG